MTITNYPSNLPQPVEVSPNTYVVGGGSFAPYSYGWYLAQSGHGVQAPGLQFSISTEVSPSAGLNPSQITTSSPVQSAEPIPMVPSIQQSSPMAAQDAASRVNSQLGAQYVTTKGNEIYFANENVRAAYSPLIERSLMNQGVKYKKTETGYSVEAENTVMRSGLVSTLATRPFSNIKPDYRGYQQATEPVLISPQGVPMSVNPEQWVSKNGEFFLKSDVLAGIQATRDYETEKAKYENDLRTYENDLRTYQIKEAVFKANQAGVPTFNTGFDERIASAEKESAKYPSYTNEYTQRFVTLGFAPEALGKSALIAGQEGIFEAGKLIEGAKLTITRPFPQTEGLLNYTPFRVPYAMQGEASQRFQMDKYVSYKEAEAKASGRLWGGVFAPVKINGPLIAFSLVEEELQIAGNVAKNTPAMYLAVAPLAVGAAGPALPVLSALGAKTVPYTPIPAQNVVKGAVMGGVLYGGLKEGERIVSKPGYQMFSKPEENLKDFAAGAASGATYEIAAPFAAAKLRFVQFGQLGTVGQTAKELSKSVIKESFAGATSGVAISLTEDALHTGGKLPATVENPVINLGKAASYGVGGAVLGGAFGALSYTSGVGLIPKPVITRVKYGTVAESAAGEVSIAETNYFGVGIEYMHKPNIIGGIKIGQEGGTGFMKGTPDLSVPNKLVNYQRSLAPSETAAQAGAKNEYFFGNERLATGNNLHYVKGEVGKYAKEAGKAGENAGAVRELYMPTPEGGMEKSGKMTVLGQELATAAYYGKEPATVMSFENVVGEIFAKPGEKEAVLGTLGKYKKESIMFGGTIERMKGARLEPTHDVDISMTGWTRKETVAQDLANTLKPFHGENVRVSPTSPGLVEVREPGGAWAHKFDIHSIYDVPDATMQGASGNYVGFGLPTKRPVTTESGFQVGQLTEQVVKKLESGTRQSAIGAMPEAHRIKDIRHGISDVETILGETPSSKAFKNILPVGIMNPKTSSPLPRLSASRGRGYAVAPVSSFVGVSLPKLSSPSIPKLSGSEITQASSASPISSRSSFISSMSKSLSPSPSRSMSVSSYLPSPSRSPSPSYFSPSSSPSPSRSSSPSRSPSPSYFSPSSSPSPSPSLPYYSPPSSPSPSRYPPYSPSPSLSPGPRIPPPMIPVNFGLPDLGGMFGGKRKASKYKRKTKYTPSLVASMFKITGSAKAGTAAALSGIAVRPIIANPFKRRKKR